MSQSVAVTVGTSPTLLYRATGPDAETVVIDNLSGSDVTIGGPTVTASNGPQQKTTSPPLTLVLYEDGVYGVVASASASVEVFAVISGAR